MSAIEARVRRLEQAPAYAAALLVQQAQAKLDAGVPMGHLSDAELEALWASVPAHEQAEVTALFRAMTDAELDAFIAAQEAG